MKKRSFLASLGALIGLQPSAFAKPVYRRPGIRRAAPEESLATLIMALPQVGAWSFHVTTDNGDSGILVGLAVDVEGHEFREEIFCCGDAPHRLPEVFEKLATHEKEWRDDRRALTIKYGLGNHQRRGA